MNRNKIQIISLRNLKWQSVDLILKMLLQRSIGKATKFKSKKENNGKTIEKTYKTKKFICWYSNTFEINEFYHIFGVPGIWFHGYLLVKNFNNPENLYFDERFGYYDFQIKSVDHLDQIFKAMKKANDELATLG